MALRFVAAYGDSFMAKMPTIYLDTSVPNALFDLRAPGRMSTTQVFWQKLRGYRVFVSELVREEIAATSDSALRARLLGTVAPFEELPVSDESVSLAREYVTRGIIPAGHLLDDMHLAVATVNAMGILVGWNFEHIVKLRTRREVNAVNVLLGYDELEIVEPAML
jgi:hypothetical protein